MPATAIRHFQQDVGRARAILAHADPLPHGTPAQQLLRGDLWRSAWMFGVGALDAYFCDAYTDIVAATIIAKSRHPALILPEFFHEIRFPVRAILEPYANNINWRWRMKPQTLTTADVVLHVLEDVEFLVRRCDEHINLEFRQFLFGTGCPAAIIAQVGY